ncbi:MAG: AMP-binding enzyme, partial [Woeseiaceae bacterium]
LGRVDADGDLFLVGRKSEMIKCAGERIIPEELERILTAHQSVSEAVVVGVEDPLLGQKIVAHLILNSDAEHADEQVVLAAIRAHCLQHVPFARAPREYRVWPDYPRKSNGKPDRKRLGETGAD